MQPGVKNGAKKKAHLQMFAKTKPTYAPHIQRERHGDGKMEKGRRESTKFRIICQMTDNPGNQIFTKSLNKDQSTLF